MGEDGVIDRYTEDKQSLSVAKMLIGTCVAKYSRVDYFQSWGCCYDIFIKEVGFEVYSRSCFNYNIQNKGDLEASSSSTNEEVSW